jgi:hypothetical protein
MLRTTVIALLAVASVGLATPTMALARGGGGGSLSLSSETQSCWQLISNRAMLLPYARGL